MRTESFYEEHDVVLTEEEIRIRDRQAGRLWPALARAETAIIDRKKEIKTMEADKAKVISTAQTAARAAIEGKEPRQVLCRDDLRGSTVFTIRCDTEETVGDRPATEPEMRDAEANARKRAKVVPMTPLELTAKLSEVLAGLDLKAHPLKWVVGKLRTAAPEATEASARDAIEAEEPDAKIRRVEHPQAPGADEGRPEGMPAH